MIPCILSNYQAECHEGMHTLCTRIYAIYVTKDKEE